MAMPFSELRAALPRALTRASTRARATPLAYALLVAAVLSCGEDPLEPPRLTAPDELVVAASDAVKDAADRIATQLDAPSGGELLHTRLTELSQRIEARDLGGVTTSLQQSRAALDVAEGGGPPEQAADRAAIRLALDGLQRLLDENH